MARSLTGAARGRLVVLPDADALAAAAAGELLTVLAESLALRREASLALAGGHTPQRLYRTLAALDRRDRIDWSRVRFFWSDERGVPPEHPDSNYGLADRTLLRSIRVAPDRVHRMEAERADRALAAAEYEALLRRHLPGEGSDAPRFDAILLGLGADGHVASLFPGRPVLDERDRLVAEVAPPGPGPSRLTFTFPLLNAARHLLVVVSGIEKRAALRGLVAEAGDPEAVPPIPARRLAPSSGELVVLADADAAGA